MYCLEKKHNKPREGAKKREKKVSERERKEEDEGRKERKRETVQSTKTVVFTLNLKTFKFFQSHCVALAQGKTGRLGEPFIILKLCEK